MLNFFLQEVLDKNMDLNLLEYARCILFGIRDKKLEFIPPPYLPMILTSSTILDISCSIKKFRQTSLSKHFVKAQ
jgi:hypothetical protein